MDLATAASPRRVLVLLCTHDGERHLEPLLASLIGQTQRPCAVEVHDWGSRDRTRELLRRWQSAHGGEFEIRVTLHDEVPGAALGFLRALRQTVSRRSDFDYLCPCDQDDVWRHDKLAALAAAAQTGADPGLLYSDVRLVDAGGRLLAPSLYGDGRRFRRPQDLRSSSALYLNSVPGMSMAVSRRFLLESRPLWASDGWVMHDWALVIAAHVLQVRTAFLPQALVDYRQHAGNAVGALRANGRRHPLAVWRAAASHVDAVRRQFDLTGAAVRLLRPGASWPAGRMTQRWCMARALWRERSLPVGTRLKMIVGYGLMW